METIGRVDVLGSALSGRLVFFAVSGWGLRVDGLEDAVGLPP